MVNTSDKFISGRLKFVPVPSVEDLVRNAQQARWNSVLQIQKIPSRKTSDRCFVFFIIPHHLFIASDAFHLHDGKDFFSEGFQFSWQVFTNVPWVPCEG